MKKFWMNHHPHVPRSHWNDLSNQRTFLDSLAKRLDITNHEGWYNVIQSVFLMHGGGGLLKKYGGSPSKLLTKVYPEYPLTKEQLFMSLCHSERLFMMLFLFSSQIRRIWLEKRNNIINILVHIIIYKWDMKRFSEHQRHRVSVGHWNTLANQRSFMNALARKLNITTQEEWYHVTQQMFVQNGASGLLQKYNGSPQKLLTSVFPEYQVIPLLFIPYIHMEQCEIW